jgi:hypothetical protein
MSVTEVLALFWRLIAMKKIAITLAFAFTAGVALTMALASSLLPSLST